MTELDSLRFDLEAERSVHRSDNEYLIKSREEACWLVRRWHALHRHDPSALTTESSLVIERWDKEI